MKRLLRLLASGRSLRHRPVALRADEQRPVRARLTSGRGTVDVTPRLFPVSLIPFVVGLHSPGDLEIGAGASVELRMEDEATGTPLGGLRLRAERVLAAPGGEVLLLRPTHARVRCVPALDRRWRHLLAWRQARMNARNPAAFAMSFPDLRALNVFYMMPRPVFLVTAAHGDAGNLFPMDLVGPAEPGSFLLALRRTSASVETMRASGRIVVSGMPAALKEAVYALGNQHRAGSIDWTRLPVAVERSPAFGLPVPADALRVRELEVRAVIEVGSHAFFDTRVAADTHRGDAPQLCHVSDMYARWREARGRPFTGA